MPVEVNNLYILVRHGYKAVWGDNTDYGEVLISKRMIQVPYTTPNTDIVVIIIIGPHA